VRRKNDHKLQRNRGRNEACYPFDDEEATGDRRQDATLDKPRRNVSGVQQVIKLEEKPRLSRTTNFHIVRVAGSRSSLAEIVPTETGRTALRFQSICLLYMGRLCCHCLFSTRIPFSGKGTEHLMQRLSRCPDTNPGQPATCVTHDLTIQAW
jgi:hypothetical protein